MSQDIPEEAYFLFYVYMSLILDQRPDLHELLKYATTTKWYLLGLALKIEPKKLDEICVNYRYLHERLTEMFKLWLRVKASGTRQDIIEALEDKTVGENYMAKKYMEYLKSLRMSPDQQYLKEKKQSQLSKQCTLQQELEHSDIISDQETLDEYIETEQVDHELPSAIFDILHKYPIHKDYLYKKCTDYLLVILSQDMKEMKYLAPYFGMSDADIQQIQRERSAEISRVISMLSRWRKRNGSNATYLALISNFYNSGHCKVAESIIINLHKKYSKPMVSSVEMDTIEFTPQKSKEYCLKWDDLPEGKKKQIRNNLIEENNKVREEFYHTLTAIRESFKLHEVHYLDIFLSLKKRHFPMSDKQTLVSLVDEWKKEGIHGVFYVIGELCSWFNYHLLDIIVSEFGSHEDKQSMGDYVSNILWPYLQRSLYEIPPESIECQEVPSESYHFVYPINADDDANEDITGQQLKCFQYLIAGKLEIPMEEVYIQFKPGSIIVHFIVDKQLFALDDVRLSGFVKKVPLDTFQFNPNMLEPKMFHVQRICLCANDVAREIERKIRKALHVYTKIEDTAHKCVKGLDETGTGVSNIAIAVISGMEKKELDHNINIVKETMKEFQKLVDEGHSFVNSVVDMFELWSMIEVNEVMKEISEGKSALLKLFIDKFQEKISNCHQQHDKFEEQANKTQTSADKAAIECDKMATDADSNKRVMGAVGGATTIALGTAAVAGLFTGGIGTAFLAGAVLASAGGTAYAVYYYDESAKRLRVIVNHCDFLHGAISEFTDQINDLRTSVDNFKKTIDIMLNIIQQESSNKVCESLRKLLNKGKDFYGCSIETLKKVNTIKKQLDSCVQVYN